MITRKRAFSLFLSLVMLAGVIPGTFANISASAAEPITSVERKIMINDDWRFNHLSASSTQNNTLDATASQPNYVESGTWNTVQLPHDWPMYRAFEDGGTNSVRAAQGSLAGGTGWYRKSFTLSNDFRDKNIVIQFDAVQKESYIWINGTLLGRQFIGYNTFEYDITQHLRFDGQENVIAVKAYSGNNSQRWYTGAGIQGSVYLIVTDKVHIPVNGIYVTPVVEVDGKYVQHDFHTKPDMDALRAKSTVNVRAKVENKTAAAAQVSVNALIYSKDNPNVASKQSEAVTVPAGQTVKIDQLIDIANPKLWSVDEPNLYWVKTEVIQDGRIVDSLDTRFGIRYIQLAPGAYTAPSSPANTLGGMYINGKYTRIYGVCEHRDIGALGLETYQAAIDRRIRKLKDMGVNVVRTAHNVVAPEFIEAADRLGMLIFEEAFDTWENSKNSQGYHQFFNRAADGTTIVFQRSASSGANTFINWLRPDLVPNAVRDIQSMVNRDKNSPSVFLWSTGNEIYDTQSGYGLDTQWLLSAAIKEIDSLDNIPYTSIIGANNRTIRPTPAQNHAALPSEGNNWTTDLATRGGRYGRPISSAPPTWDSGVSAMIDNMALSDIGGHNYSRASNQYNTGKLRYPNMNFAGTETASAFYTRGIYTLADYRTNEDGARWASNTGYAAEWPFNRNFVTASVTIREHREDMMPFLYGEMVWTGHDYLGEPTPHGYPSRSSYFGIIDTAGFEKDAFYMYRSAWSDAPTVHLLPQNWNWDMGTQVPVMVYTNAASVEVFINDRSIGVRQYNKATARPVYVDYGRQAYQPGELKAVARNAAGEIIGIDTVYTAGPAESVLLSGDRSFIKNDGRDLLFVEATVVDSAGNMVPDANNRVTFNVTGGEIVAMDNGNPRDSDPFRGTNNNYNRNTATNRRAFNGKVLAIIKATKGSVADIVVSATAVQGGITIGSNTITAGSRANIGDGTRVYDFETPEVTTGVGITPVMPAAVGTIYDNGLIEQFKVDSWDLSAVNLAIPGSYTAYGSSLSVSGRVEAIVHVKAVASIDNMSVTTIVNVAPSLPRNATVRYADGTAGAAPIAWEPVSPAQYAAEGTFTVNGSIGPAMGVAATVYVKQLMSVDDITISTEVSKMPTMPSTVMSKFTDGSEEMLGVSWDLAAGDIAFPGVVKVIGHITGSDIKATAWLVVRSVVYLSDLDWVSATQDVGAPRKDRTVNGNILRARNLQGSPPTDFLKGIGTLANSEIVYDISGNTSYDRFQAFVSLGFDFGQGAPGAVVYKVYLDNVLAYESGVMTHAPDYETIDLNIKGKSTLKLVAETAGDFEPQYNLADWCDAKLLLDNTGNTVLKADHAVVEVDNTRREIKLTDAVSWNEFLGSIINYCNQSFKLFRADGVTEVAAGSLMNGMTVLVIAENGVDTARYAVRLMDLALFKPIKASFVEGDFVASNANDGNNDTRWSAYGTPAGSGGNWNNWIEVDLGDYYDINRIETMHYLGSARTYNYEVWVKNTADNNWNRPIVISRDFTAEGYTRVLTASSVNVSVSVARFPAGTKARYVVVRVPSGANGATTGTLHNLEIFGWKLDSDVYEIDKDAKAISIPLNTTAEAFMGNMTVFGHCTAELTGGEFVNGGDKLVVTDSNGFATEYAIGYVDYADMSMDPELSIIGSLDKVAGEPNARYSANYVIGNKSDAPKGVSLILGVYDSKGVMRAVKAEERLGIAAKGSVECRLVIDIPEQLLASGYSVKAFAWEATTFIPLSNALTG